LQKGILIGINKMSGMLSGEDFACSNAYNFKRLSKLNSEIPPLPLRKAECTKRLLDSR